MWTILLLVTVKQTRGEFISRRSAGLHTFILRKRQILNGIGKQSNPAPCNQTAS